jgi:hypothetical protein
MIRNEPTQFWAGEALNIAARDGRLPGVHAELDCVPRSAVLKVEPYTEDLETSVKAFNMRLRDGGEGKECFPETAVRDFPKLPLRSLYQESFLAVEAGQVRGGYHLKHQKFFILGKEEKIVGGPQHMVSEGIVNAAYTMVGVFLLQNALEKQPLLYVVGMGGKDERLPRLLKAARWTLHPIPFYCKVLNPSSFLANLTYLRRHQSGELLLDLLRCIGSVALRILEFRSDKRRDPVCAESFVEFGTWADKVWEASKDRYSFVALRDRGTLNLLYPPSNSKFLRLKMLREAKTIGWAIMLDSQLYRHQQLGTMRLGTIVDCLSSPEDAYWTIACATKFLKRRNVDLIISNQANSVWCSALDRNGYMRVPSSNFILGLSPKLAERLQPFGELKHRIHMNRGDGDGPMNL